MAESNHEASIYNSNIQQQQQNEIEDEDDDVVGGDEESIDNPQMRFVPVSTLNGAVQEVAPNAVFVPGGSDYPPVNTGNGGSDQLTLSFQGEVYVFDAVSPDKVLNFVTYDLCFGGDLSEGGLWVLVSFDEFSKLLVLFR